MKISRRSFHRSLATCSLTAAFATLPGVCPTRVLGQDKDDTSDADTNQDSPAEDAPQSALRDKIHQVLDYYYEKNESAAQRSPWGVMHAAIPFGVDAQIVASGRKVNAIGWLCWNQPCRGIRMLELRRGGLNAKQGPGVQGHAGQLLAILAQSRVSPDYVIKVGGREFTIMDLVELEKKTCRPGTELTFKLIGLSHYLDSDDKWKCDRGQQWDIPRLIREEIKQPVIGAACGGTHRLMGYSYAVWRRKKQDQPVEGQWSRAEKYVSDYQDFTFKLQNRDGSFSTNWFSGRGANPSLARRIQTTGHILEWMAFSLPQEKLEDERLTRAVDYLATVLLENRREPWEVGPLGHALHALAIYDHRVYGTPRGHRNLRIASEANGK